MIPTGPSGANCASGTTTTIQPKPGFPPHPHNNMEIITYVREGAITHRDNLGNAGRTEAGDVQVMSAGSGIAHSEYNMEDEVTRIFQIWILPDQAGGQPQWGAKPFPRASAPESSSCLLPGIEGDGDALPIRANARVVGATVKAGETAVYPLGKDRKAYLVPATGRVEIDGQLVEARDGAAIGDMDEVRVTASRIARSCWSTSPDRSTQIKPAAGDGGGLHSALR